MKTHATQALHTAALTGFLSLAFLPPATAADFPGSLKSVTITDAQADNKPPTAAFTYTVNGETVNFDASGSSDTDGTISQYKWDFGDGTQGTGISAQHTYQNTENKEITLTVTDNNTAVSLVQSILSFNVCSKTPSYEQENTNEANGTGGWLQYYTVGALYTGTKAYKICSLEFYVKEISGIISNKSYTVNIYTRSGNNLGIVLASKVLSGSNVIKGWNTVSFDTPIDTGTSGFAIVIIPPSTSGDVNSFSLAVSTNNGLSEWTTRRWLGTIDNSFMDLDMAVRIYE